MIVTLLDGTTRNWSPIYQSTNKVISKLQAEAITLIRQLVPGAMILNEVSIPVKRNKTLYLDLYVPMWSFAVEIMGKQHKTLTKHFHKNRKAFARQIENDELKAEWCRLNKITLIELDYDNTEEWLLILQEKTGIKL